MLRRGGTGRGHTFKIKSPGLDTVKQRPPAVQPCGPEWSGRDHTEEPQTEHPTTALAASQNQHLVSASIKDTAVCESPPPPEESKKL